MKIPLKKLVGTLSLALIFFSYQSVSVFAKDLTIVTVEKSDENQELIVSEDSVVNAELGTLIPKMIVKDGAEIVEINAEVHTLEVISQNTVELIGDGNITEVIISTQSNVAINTTGNINKLQITNSASRIVVKEGTKIAELRIPVGTKVTDIITNYEQAKDRFENIIGGESVQPESPEFTTPPAEKPPVVEEEPTTPPVVEEEPTTPPVVEEEPISPPVTMSMAYNDKPIEPVTSLLEGYMWSLFRVTLTGDTFKSNFRVDNVQFGGDLAGLSINGYVPPGSSYWGLGMNEVILDGVNGTITNETGHGTITLDGTSLEGGKSVTLNVTVSAP